MSSHAHDWKLVPGWCGLYECACGAKGKRGVGGHVVALGCDVEDCRRAAVSKRGRQRCAQHGGADHG